MTNEAFFNTLNKISSQEFEDTHSFKMACRSVEEAALHDPRLSEEVLTAFDDLMTKGNIPQDVSNEICYSFSEMAHFQPEMKKQISGIAKKHSSKITEYLDNYSTPYSDELKDMVKVQEKINELRKNKGIEKTSSQPQQNQTNNLSDNQAFASFIMDRFTNIK